MNQDLLLRMGRYLVESGTWTVEADEEMGILNTYSQCAECDEVGPIPGSISHKPDCIVGWAKRAADAIDDGEKAVEPIPREWTPVSDRVILKNRHLVLVWHQGSYSVAYSTDKEDAFDPGWRYASPGNPPCFGVTHWMDLPKQPPVHCNSEEK